MFRCNVCGLVAVIALAEQMYVLIASGGNLGLVRILCRHQWMFNFCTDRHLGGSL